MRLKPPPGKKRVVDWTDMRVRSLRDFSNGVAKLPAGTLWTVEQAGGTGLHLISDPCSCCGVRIRMTRVSDQDVRVHVTTAPED